MSSKLILPRIVLRERTAPEAKTAVNMEPQTMRWQVIREGKVVRESEQDCHNLVLDNGKDLVATYGFNQTAYAAVGTGNTAPAASQTGLVAETARTNTAVTGATTGWSEVSTGVWEYTQALEFSAAQVGGKNLAEWGFSAAAAVAGNLMSRELFRDGSNNPIVLTLDADQQLRLIYKIRVTVGPTAPTAASINITNIGNRAGKVVLMRNTADPFGGPQCPVDWLSQFVMGNANPRTLRFPPAAFSNSILQYANTDSFTSGGIEKTTTVQAYTAGSKVRVQNDITLTSAEGVQTIYGYGPMDSAGRGRVRAYFQFDTGQEFAKDNLHTLTVPGFKVTWT